MKIFLYSSKDCCLCDDAKAIVEKSLFYSKIDLEKKDIYLDKALLIKYKVHIPVLYAQNTSSELYWPFDLVCLESWLEKQIGR
ncbi:MAG: hypothetical protein ACI93R_002826 [Flavobacteriales bacterium]|jgi:hypothetical protein